MEHLTPAQIAELQTLLRRQSEHLTLRLTERGGDGLTSSPRQSAGELSCCDNHPADIGTEVFEQSKEITLNENAEAHLREVNEALARIAAGQYNGLCARCGQPIPYERLLAIPETLYCVAHVPERETSRRRPVEERLLPLSEHYSIDERIDETAFAYPDTWSIVANWGNSDSPAMSRDREVRDYDDMAWDADEADDDYVEAFESFIATDIYGQHASFVRNKAYRRYMDDLDEDPDFIADPHSAADPLLGPER